MTISAEPSAYALQPVVTQPRDWATYAGYMSSDVEAEVRERARELRGCRVVHVNATPRGGGVAEMLVSLVPLLRSLGVRVDWFSLPPIDGGFFEVTKRLHNGLQGDATEIPSRQWDLACGVNSRLAAAMRGISADVWVIHDPQPLPLAARVPLAGRTIWRCHIDCSQPNPAVAATLMPWIRAYDQAVFSMPAYVLPGLSAEHVALEYPAIDPLAPKNRALSRTAAQQRLAGLGVDPRRPLICQVSRFDPWKNPWQVVDAYRQSKRRICQLQLALVGVFSAKDDPEGPRIYESVRDYAGGDPDVHLFTDPGLVGDLEINAFQTASDVILQRSTREGFGLVVTEAMWKRRPVIGTPVGGIAAQIEHGSTGVLATSTEDCADWIVRLIEDAQLAHSMGTAARASVFEQFLLPRLVHDELRLYTGEAIKRPLTTRLECATPSSSR